jgi:hypothetical protein
LVPPARSHPSANGRSEQGSLSGTRPAGPNPVNPLRPQRSRRELADRLAPDLRCRYRSRKCVSPRMGITGASTATAVGNSCSPQKILAAAKTKRRTLARPERRTASGNSLRMLMSRSAVNQRAVPEANEGTLAAGPAAVPDSNTASLPIRCYSPQGAAPAALLHFTGKITGSRMKGYRIERQACRFSRQSASLVVSRYGVGLHPRQSRRT